MSNYNNTKATIAANVYTNHVNQVTAEMVKTAINAVVDTIIAGGFLYKGVAIPTTNPGSPDANVAYIAATPGTYTNFGGLVVADGEVAVLKYNGSWSKEVTGAATAAEVSALGHKVGVVELEKMLDAGAITFVNGGFLDSTGAVANTTNKIRSSVLNKSCKVAVPDGFLIYRVYYYSAWSSDSSFTFSQGVPINAREAEITISGTNAYARFSIQKTDNSSIVVEDLYNALVLLDSEICNKVDGLTDPDTFRRNGRYIKWSDGVSISTGTYFDTYEIPNKNYKAVKAHCGFGDNVPAAIAFYSGKDIISANYISSASVRANTSYTDYEALVPAGCQMIVVTNRNSVVANPAITLIRNVEGVYRALKEENKQTNDSLAYISKKIGIIPTQWELGNITINTSGWTYSYSNTRVRLKQGTTIHLLPGDTIGMTDYTDARFYIGWLTSGGLYRANGWNTSDFKVYEEGDYVVLLCNITEVSQSSPDALSSLFFIYSSLSNSYLRAKFVENDPQKNNTKVNGLLNRAFTMGNHPCYGHLFINGIHGSHPAIPCQSIFDVDATARLGFKFIEVNVQKTSDNVLIPLHGVSGTFGREVTDLNGDFTYEDTMINSVTYSWIAANLVYDSSIEKHKVAVPTLEELLAEIKRHGMSVMMTYTAEAYALARKYFGEDWIAYGGNRNAGFAGMIMQYSSLSTKSDILAACDTYGAPYIHMLNPSAFATFNTAGTLADLAQAVHEKGCLLGIAGCYHSTDDILAFFAAGGDVSATDSFVNDFQDGNICNLKGDDLFGDFICGGTASDGVLTLSDGDQVTTPAYDRVYIGKGSLWLRFSGTLRVNYFGKSTGEFTSDGSSYLWLSTYFLQEVPYLEMTAVGSCEIYSMNLKMSKC